MFPYRPKPHSQCAFSQTVLPENGTLWYIMVHEQTHRDTNNCTRTTSQGRSEPGSKCGGGKWLYISPICTGVLPVLRKYKQFSCLSTTENPAQNMEFLCISQHSLACCHRPGQAGWWLAWSFPWKSQGDAASPYF